MNGISADNRARSRLALVDYIAYLVLVFGTGLAVAVALGGVVLLLAGDAAAAELRPMQPREVQQGTLLFRKGGETVAVPAVATEVGIRVSGIAARALVRQTYRNPYEEWFEGIYVFPLPENAAVDHLRLRIGERVIEGDIRERRAARAAYEQAKAGGQRAALVEQERPNIFTTNVANIGPGQEVVVEIEYQQRLRFDADHFSLRFPMVVGPRYIPGAATGASGTGWSPDTDQVPDASRITPPVLHPDRHAPGNPVRLKVELDAGVPLARIDSAYHAITRRELEDGRQLIELAAGEVPANRDFELTWTPAAGHAPQAALFTEHKGEGGAGRDYALLMLLPPAAQAAAARLPREVVFVIDTSGSMSGASIGQAKEALALAVARLGEADRFNVIEFNSRARALWAEARPASFRNRGLAGVFVRTLRADGGTEMALALDLALKGREDPARVRQVVFLTDGAVGNEEALFKLIQTRLGDSRLFTVGIGSAPNSHFMSKAAEAGRGSFTYIGKVEEVKEKMSALFAKLESPVLKGIEIAWPAGAKAEAWPRHIPDLYLGEPIVVSAALEQAAGEIRLSGLSGDAPWQATLRLDEARPAAGPGVLWAREKIQALVDGLREGAAEDAVRDAVVAVATEHHLASKYTSLVAVDKTPVRPAEAALASGAIPTNLPEGWQHEAVFGELPQGATDASWHLVAGALSLLLALGLLAATRRPACA